MVQDAEWAAKPCSERWSPKRRPCPFYECGRDCERTWASEAGDLYVVCRAAMLAYLTGVVLYLTYLLHGSRRERRREGRRKDSWNALEHLTACFLMATVVQLAAWYDVDGFGGRTKGALNDFLPNVIRLFFELGLFRACETYRVALDGMLRRQKAGGDAWRSSVYKRLSTNASQMLKGFGRGASRDTDAMLRREPATTCRVVVASLAATAWGLGFAVYNRWNPNLRDARGACWGLAKNTAYHVGSCVLEVSFLGETLAYSYRVRARLRGAADLSGGPSARTTSAIALIGYRICFMQFALASNVAWGANVVHRNLIDGKVRSVFCFQPPCTTAAALQWLSGYFVFGALSGLACLALRRPPEIARHIARGLKEIPSLVHDISDKACARGVDDDSQDYIREKASSASSGGPRSPPRLAAVPIPEEGDDGDGDVELADLPTDGGVAGA